MHRCVYLGLGSQESSWTPVCLVEISRLQVLREITHTQSRSRHHGMVWIPRQLEYRILESIEYPGRKLGTASPSPLEPLHLSQQGLQWVPDARLIKGRRQSIDIDSHPFDLQ